ncbi:MAG: hypothetical protein FJ041_02925 [Candidatus Cloacimonetes bacterium]|nr:hypothetical protein [Candidatus Cloacimonadota bacterium]
MRCNTSMISVIINFAIIFFIFQIIGKALKKQKNSNQRPSADINKTQEKTIIIPKQPQAKKVIRKETQTYGENLQLKRCPNCGGEIPLTMMKCSICGTKQQGCGTFIFIFIIVVAMIIGIIFSQSGGQQIIEMLKEVFNSI